MNINDTLRQAAKALENVSDTPMLDARVLLCEALDKSSLYLITHPTEEISAEAVEKFNTMIAKRTKNMPVAYIVGRKEFMGMDFYVDERVLIPRADTEILAEKAIELIGKNHASVLDMCCGSGCIGLSVKKFCENVSLTLSDISGGAVEVTTQNAKAHFGNDGKINIVRGDLFENIHGKFDFILSNPPYISYDEMKTLSKDILDYEPHTALEAQSEGLWFYEEITSQSEDYLNEGGYIIFEIGYLQGDAVKNILEKNGFADIKILKDLAGLDRVVAGRKK